MRQNIGLACLTLGSILLSVKVFWGTYFRDENDLPMEQRIFYKLTGGKKLLDMEKQNKKYEEVMRCQNDEKFRKKVQRRAKCSQRISGDLPIVALMLVIIGFFLCSNH
jgi:hypothetical protein